MDEGSVKLDREMKVLLLNVLKKGYFDVTDTQQLGKYGLFNIPIDEWIRPFKVEVIDRRDQVEMDEDY